MILDAGADPNSVLKKTYDYRTSYTTALFWAAFRENSFMFHTLISRGATLNNRASQSALTGAVLSKYINMIRTCIQLGANPYDPAALCLAVSTDDNDVPEIQVQHSVQQMIIDRRLGQSSSKVQNNGKAALKKAIMQGDLTLVTRLIRAGTGLEGLCLAWRQKYRKQRPSGKSD